MADSEDDGGGQADDKDYPFQRLPVFGQLRLEEAIDETRYKNAANEDRDHDQKMFDESHGILTSFSGLTPGEPCGSGPSAG